MGMHQQRWDIARIRRRHRAYRNLLLLELLMVWLIPFSQRFPLIIDLSAVALELFFLHLVVHLSVLRSGRRLVYALGGCSLLVELLWIGSRHGGAAVAIPVPWIGSLALLLSSFRTLVSRLTRPFSSFTTPESRTSGPAGPLSVSKPLV